MTSPFHLMSPTGSAQEFAQRMSSAGMYSSSQVPTPQGFAGLVKGDAGPAPVSMAKPILGGPMNTFLGPASFQSSGSRQAVNPAAMRITQQTKIGASVAPWDEYPVLTYRFNEQRERHPMERHESNRSERQALLYAINVPRPVSMNTVTVITVDDEAYLSIFFDRIVAHAQEHSNDPRAGSLMNPFCHVNSVGVLIAVLGKPMDRARSTGPMPGRPGRPNPADIRLTDYMVTSQISAVVETWGAFSVSASPTAPEFFPAGSPAFHHVPHPYVKNLVVRAFLGYFTNSHECVHSCYDTHDPRSHAKASIRLSQAPVYTNALAESLANRDFPDGGVQQTDLDTFAESELGKFKALHASGAAATAAQGSSGHRLGRMPAFNLNAAGATGLD